MIYTIFFYLILSLVLYRQKGNTLKWACIVVAIYYGIRYNYMPDYMGYYRTFENYCNPNFVYDPDFEHMEVGWYYVSKLFIPLGVPYGFFVFVFVCSCILAYGVYRILKVFDIDQSLLPIVMIGYFTVPATCVLCSAQRQFLVTGIFLIAYSYLLYGKFNTWKDLYSKNTLIYYAVIAFCTTLHSSSSFLFIVPLFHLLPSKSRYASWLVLLGFAVFFIFAEKYLPLLMRGYMQQTNSYEYMEETFGSSDLESITITAVVSYAVQIFFCASALSIKNLNKNDVFVIGCAILSLIFALSGFYVKQLNRIGLYLNFFTYLSMAILSVKLPANFRKIFSVMMWIFIIWNALKVLQPAPLVHGRDVSYKTIFEVIFQ